MYRRLNISLAAFSRVPKVVIGAGSPQQQPFSQHQLWQHEQVRWAATTGTTGDGGERSSAVLAALRDIHRTAERSGGVMAMQRVVLTVTPQTKNVIFKSNLGVEKFLRSNPDFFSIELRGGEKMVRANPLPLEESGEGSDVPRAASSGVKVVDAHRAAKRVRQTANTQPYEAPPSIGSLGTVRSQQSDTSTATGGNHSTTDSSASDSAGKQLLPIPDDVEGAELIRIIFRSVKRGQYYNTNEVYNALYRTDQQKQMCKYKDFDAFVKTNPKFFWTIKSGLFAPRCVDETAPPSMATTAPQPQQQTPTASESSTTGGSQAGASAVAGKAAPVAGQDVLPPLPYRDCGGWSSPPNAPTAEDVYEILKYVPVDWGQLGNLNVPNDVKKRHCRIRSFLEWLRRQPQYFEIRSIRGTLEVRRSVVLHPEQHGMSKEEAQAYVQQQVTLLAIETAPQTSSQPSPASQPASAPTSTGTSGTSATPASTTEASGGSSSATVGQPTPNMWRDKTAPLPTEDEQWQKFLMRVCPSYFVTVAQILRRAPKKGTWHPVTLLEQVDANPGQFDVMTLPNDTKLVRKRTGVDSSKWGDGFKRDLEAAIAAEEIEPVMALMTKTCCLWDRTHFLYVRLSDEEKTAVNGHDGMIEMMRRYPTIFKAGEYFVRRVDSSDPIRDAADVEPLTGDITASVRVVDENPYHSSAELAAVFFYLTPEKEATSLAYFVECCSPAMRSVLPPRIVTLFQSYPNLFVCRELSPGSFSVSRAVQQQSGSSTGGTPSATPSAEDEERQLVEAIKRLIPSRGADASQIQSWMQPEHLATLESLGLDVLQLVKKNQAVFDVVSDPPYCQVFLRSQR